MEVLKYLGYEVVRIRGRNKSGTLTTITEWLKTQLAKKVMVS